jgi:hypothetical protein
MINKWSHSKNNLSPHLNQNKLTLFGKKIFKQLIKIKIDKIKENKVNMSLKENL